MADLKEQLQKIQQLRKQRDDCDESLYLSKLGLFKTENLLRQLKRKETPPGNKMGLAARVKAGEQSADELIVKRRMLKEEYGRLKKERALCHDNLQKGIEDIYVKPHPREIITELNDGIPFLLLPVRIETRFIDAGGGTELWLRIYPDDIAVHTHEKLLTDKEVAEGITYWKELFNAEKSGGARKEDRKKSAWSNLASLFGPQRSAWIARQTKPANWTPDLGGIDSEDQLLFPPHDQTKTHAWSRAPRTKILPDKFVVMLYQGDTIVREVVGPVVPDELFVGPDPLEAEEAYENKDNKLLFGESFNWTSDFDKAVDLGMGFKIPLNDTQASAGFSKILVLGVYLSDDETESKQCLEELIDNHHYSPKGFSVVLQGTPTNNTEQDGSGYTKNDQFNTISYYVETGDPLFTAADDCDGRNLADALGIEYDPLTYILNGDAADYQQAVAMNKALYPATLGYFFETLLRPVFGEEDLDTIRRFFVNHVTGRGPLPAVRVGNQPYGIVLTSDFGKWRWGKQEAFSDGSFLNTLYAVLSQYQNIWDGLLNDLMHVGKPGKDPNEVLMNVLGLQAGSVSFYQRTGYSTDYLKNLDDFQYGNKYGADVAKNYTQKNDVLNFFNQFGYNTRDEAGVLSVPQALRLVYQHYTTLLDAANLVDNAPLSEKKSVRYYDELHKKNYLHWLAEASTIEALEQQNFGAGKTAPNALLYLELRRALLLQLHKASVLWFKKHDLTLDQTLQAANFYNIRPQGDLTKYEVMKAKVGVAAPGHPYKTVAVSDYLLTAGRDEGEAQYLNEMRASLKTLAEASTAQLERCFTEHMDTCTYRLDAWQTALFRLRLLKQRNLSGPDTGKERKKGIYIGAYGWLENILPAGRRQVAVETVPEKLRPANNQPLFEYADNGGFVHAPSLNHASAAAILRSGYLSHADSGNPDMMAVNLSSERVRRALFILQGMRNGQALEALLGYQFERGLHDRASADDALKKLNLYLYDFRDKFPYQQHQVRQQGSTDAATESIPAVNVVNGAALAESTSAFPYGASGAVSAANADERKAIEQEKDKLADTLDAVKDLLLAESAYQMVQGNFDRSGAVLNALKDTHIPPELDVINTPRGSHFTFTNRVTIHFENADPGVAANNPWDPVVMTPRAEMEAGLNKWLGAVLGMPDNIVYRVAHLNADGNEIGNSVMTVENLALQPIDLVYITGNELNTGAPENNKEARTAASELESRIAYRYRQEKVLDDDVLVRIEFMKPEMANKKTLGQLLPLLRMLKSMIIDSRHLHAEDFDPPSKTSLADKNNPKNYDAADLGGRIENSISSFQSNLQDLKEIAIDAVVKDKAGDLHACAKLQDAVTVMTDAKLTFNDINFIDFSAHEFTGNYSVIILCDKLRNEGFVIGGGTLGDINGLLQIPDLYEKVIDKHTEQLPTNELKALKIKYDALKNGNDLKQLNRAVLEEFYPQITPKGQYENGIIFRFDTTVELQEALVRLSQFGIPDVFPKLISVVTNEDKKIMLEQALRVARTAGDALTRAQDMKSKADTASDIQITIEKYISAAQALIGEAFNIIPLFNYNNEADIQQSNADRPQLLKHAADKLKMTFVADEWLQNVSHVRPKLTRWDYIRTLMESINSASLELKPVQLPYRAKDSWLAVEFPETYEVINEEGGTTQEPFNIVHDTLSVVVHGDAAFTPAAKQCGLLIDDWTEGIPTKEEITGITLNYNQPNACPPQALLLAITPQEKGHWNWDDLVGILNDTLQRAKRRAVEPIMLDKVDRSELNVLLPAIVADFSQYDLNVSLDYRLNLQYFAQAMPMVSVVNMASDKK